MVQEAGLRLPARPGALCAGAPQPRPGVGSASRGRPAPPPRPAERLPGRPAPTCGRKGAARRGAAVPGTSAGAARSSCCAPMAAPRDPLPPGEDAARTGRERGGMGRAVAAPPRPLPAPAAAPGRRGVATGAAARGARLGPCPEPGTAALRSPEGSPARQGLKKQKLEGLSAAPFPPRTLIKLGNNFHGSRWCDLVQLVLSSLLRRLGC